MGSFHEILTAIDDKLNNDIHFQDTLIRFKLSNEKHQLIDELQKNGCFQRPDTQTRQTKKNEESAKYRASGNKFFERKTNANYLKALEFYNKCICYAENDSEEIGLGFANRSAVYFKLRLYDDCLQNIKHAKRTCHG